MNIDERYSQAFSGLTRASWGSGTHGGSTGGFYLGGWQGHWTSSKTPIDGYFSSTGVVFYNYTDVSWNNFTTDGLHDTGVYFGYAAGGTQYVPTYGTGGLLVILGGETFLDSSPYPWNNITVYDVASKKWYWQPTSGEAPTPGKRIFCNVGKESPNGTYEIFLYGGTADNPDVIKAEADALHILSLPAFVWHKIDITSGEREGRTQHSCTIAGNRQMISTGEQNPLLNSTEDPTTGQSEYSNSTDPYALAIKVLDLTALEWTNTYNSSALAYEAPQLIQDYYGGKLRYPKRWAQPALKEIFLTHSSKATPAGNGSSTSTVGSTPAASRTSLGAGHKSSDTGSIAGGVVGGVVGLLLFTFVIWWFCVRKRKHERTAELDNNHLFKQPELEDSHRTTKYEMGNGADSTDGKAELYAPVAGQKAIK